MAKKTYLNTPFAKLSLVHLNKPDVYEGVSKYKTKFSFPSKEDEQLVIARIKEFAEDQSFSRKEPLMPWKDDEKYGIQFQAASQFKPMLVDSRMSELPEDVTIIGGTTARLELEMFNYKKGVSLRLKSVQVVQLGGSNHTSSFDALDEGYVAPSAPVQSDDSEDDDKTSALDI